MAEEITEERQCQHCGATFTVASPASRKVLCSSRCTQAAYHERQRAAREPLAVRVCEVCGEEFTPKKAWAEDDPLKRGRFCSRKCKEKARISAGGSSLSTRRWRLQSLYGLTIERYGEILEEQGGGCAICGTTDPVGRRATRTDEQIYFHVDHDHETGLVRGLLCMECNTGLGKFRDEPERLLNALRYLARHREAQERWLDAAVHYLRGCKL